MRFFYDFRPTTVFTGILKLPIIPIFLGSLPSILLIFPTVVSAGALLKISEGSYWEMLSTMSLLGAGGVQGMCVVGSMWFIMAKIKSKKEEFAKMPLDQEVLVMENGARERETRYQACTSWHEEDFPVCMKMVLVLGAFLVGSSAYLSALGADWCFVPFAVTDTIADKLRGSALNVVLPVGWVALSLFGAGVVCMFIFAVWAKLRMKTMSAEKQQLKITNAEARKTKTPQQETPQLDSEVVSKEKSKNSTRSLV